MVLISVLINNFRIFIESIIDSRKTTTITSSSTDEEYPTAKAVNDRISELEERISDLENQ